MSLIIESEPKSHTPPTCGETGKLIFPLNERDFMVLGDGDRVYRICPEGGGCLTVEAEILDGEMTYRYKCVCGLYSIES